MRPRRRRRPARRRRSPPPRPRPRARRACTTPSAVNVRSSVPRSASSAKTTLVRVPSTSAPSRVMDGDASTSAAVTGRRATAAFVSSPESAFGEGERVQRAVHAGEHHRRARRGSAAAPPRRSHRPVPAGPTRPARTRARAHQRPAGREAPQRFARRAGNSLHGPVEEGHQQRRIVRRLRVEVPAGARRQRGDACHQERPRGAPATHAAIPLPTRRGDCATLALDATSSVLSDRCFAAKEIASFGGLKPTRAARYFRHPPTRHNSKKCSRGSLARDREMASDWSRGYCFFLWLWAAGAFACPSRS